MIKILLADIQPLTALGLTHLFEGERNLTLVDQVKTREEFPKMLKRHLPDLLIADYTLPDYLTMEDLVQVEHVSPRTNVLILSNDNSKKNIIDVLRTGVKGYLTKDCDHQEIVTAVQTIAKGEKFFCQKILNVILEKSLTHAEEPRRIKSPLTVRELELLKLLAKGYSTVRAAEALNLSPHTIHTHRKKIIKKLAIKSPTEFVLHAMDLGLINPT